MVFSGRLRSPAAGSGAGPYAMLATLRTHWPLIWRLAKRELAARYRGSMLGALWGLLTPLLMLSVYTFVFRTVFQARWSSNDASNGEFALLLFAGLILFNVFSECVTRAPGLMLENVSYIKKVVFPLEILPVVTLVVSLCNAATGFAILGLFYGPVFGAPPPTLLLLPLPLLPLCLLTLGLSWFLASAGVFLRDIRQFIGVAVTMLMFMSPIFYPSSVIPESMQPVLMLNPLAPILEQARDLLFWGRLPDWPVWFLTTTVSALCAWLGYLWFVKTRKGFADVV